MNGTHYPQFCALARSAEILGERWTLLIIRELLIGPKRFGDLVDGLASVSPTVLTSRLNALTESGVVRRVTTPAPFNVQVYELTDIGLALKPAIFELIRWGGYFLFPVRPDDQFDPDWVILALEAIVRSSPSPAVLIHLRVAHKSDAVDILVRGGEAGTRLSKGDGPADATIETGFDSLLRMTANKLTLDKAVSEGLVRVKGSRKAARNLPRLFDLR